MSQARDGLRQRTGKEGQLESDGRQKKFETAATITGSLTSLTEPLPVSYLLRCHPGRHHDVALAYTLGHALQDSHLRLARSALCSWLRVSARRARSPYS